MKKKRLIAIAAFILVILSVYMLQANRYYQRDFLGSISSLSNANETYIFLQRNTTVVNVTRWNQMLASWFAITRPSESHTKKNLVVAHLKQGKATLYSQEDFDVSGQLVAVDGTPYLVQGGYQISGYRWNGAEFVGVDPKTLAKVKDFLMSKDDSSKDNSWNQLDWRDFGMIGADYNKAFHVGTFNDRQVLLQVRTGSFSHNKSGFVMQNPPIKIVLSFNNEELTLMESSQDFERISREQFEKKVVTSKE